MDPSGIMCEGEWGCLSGMYETNESDFMTQLLGEFSPSSVLDGECRSSLDVQSNFFPCQMSANADLKVNDGSFVYSSDPSSSDPSSSNACFYSQDNSTYSGSDGGRDMAIFLFGYGAYYQVEDSNNESDTIPCYYNLVDFGIEQEENLSSTAFVSIDLVMQLDEDSALPKNSAKAEAENDETLHQADVYHQSMKFEVPPLIDDIKEKGTSLPVDSKKRPHSVEAQKNKRNVKPRRGKKITETTSFKEDMSKQATSSDCSKDNANAPSHSVDVSSMTMEEDITPSSRNVKTRASRGSATDPQSLYARKRREKINERLKILQGLVPNGTKVDISTMLDEAVQYVKFLQLQIKLLSSDDMWMYAPLAYNGMDLGLDI